MEIIPCLLEDGGYLLRAQIADAALVRVVDFLFGNELPGLDVEPDLLVGIAERHALAGQAVHLLYGEHQVVARVVEDVLVHLEPCDDVGGHLQALSQLLESGEEDFLDDLQVAEIAARQVVHNERNLLRQSLKLVALGASQLEDIRVLLVRHDAGAGCALLRQLDETEVLAVEEAGIEGELADGSCYSCKSEGDVALSLAAPHLGIDHVVVERIEAQQLRRHRAVQRERRAVTGGRAKRVAVGDAIGSLQEHEIIREALGISTKPKAEAAGHRHLKMRVAWHQYVFVALALALQLSEETPHVLCHKPQLLADE